MQCSAYLDIGFAIGSYAITYFADETLLMNPLYAEIWHPPSL